MNPILHALGAPKLIILYSVRRALVSRVNAGTIAGATPCTLLRQ